MSVISGSESIAETTARFLVVQGTDRVFGLCGGHIQPLWDALVRAGIEIVDVRHEASAVHMAHAHAEITGKLAVALVTAGPGLTNAVTAIANADASRVPVLVLSGRAPRPQSGMHAMQDLPQSAIVAPIVRRAERLEHPRHLLDRLTGTVRAALGVEGAPGPAYLDVPADLWETPHDRLPHDEEWFVPVRREPREPGSESITAAAGLLSRALRPLIIGGRGTLDAPRELADLVEASGAIYLESSDSRGSLPGHPSAAGAMRGRALAEADVVVTIGRVLDFQVGYGSPAALAHDVRLVRIGRSEDELVHNRRAAVEVFGDAAPALRLLAAQLRSFSAPSERTWRASLIRGHRERARRLEETIAQASVEPDGGISPYALIREVNALVADDAITVADGGDILSFARIALRAPRHLDCGPLGCLGVGTPFAIGAALARPREARSGPVLALIGDGSFGFTAIEVDTAVRHRADVVLVIANNAGWNIEKRDQLDRFDARLTGVDLPGCRYGLLATAFGAHGEQVEDLDDLGPALRRAAANTPAVVDVRISGEPISPDFASGLASVPDYQPLSKWNDAERALRSR